MSPTLPFVRTITLTVAIPLAAAFAAPLKIDFSRGDQGGDQPLQAGWLGFSLPATGGDEVALAFAEDELAGPGGAVAVTVAGNSHTRDYAPATGIFEAQSDLLSDGPLLNLPGIITLSFDGLLDGSYALTSYHHTTQFGASERGPATPFDVRLTDAGGANRPIAAGLTVSDNSSAATTTHTTEFVVSGGSAVHIDFVRGPDQGAPDHFAIAGFELELAGPPPPPVVLGEVLLNEFMASNNDTLLDGDGNSSDWIEIWNSTAEAVDLSGWFLSNNSIPRWPFPPITLAPDAYLIVFASGQPSTDYVDAGGNLHTNFKIEKTGTPTLSASLFKPDGAGELEIASEIRGYPDQQEDISYGFFGAELPLDIGYFTQPTPGAKNGAAPTAGFVPDTRFGIDRGLHDAPFTTTIGTAVVTEGVTIRYTLDGSAPTAEHGAVYDAPIPIDTTTILRARAFKDGFAPTNIDTQSYIFPDHVPDQPTTPAGFPTTWTGWDYAMDQDLVSLRSIVNDPSASELGAKTIIADALRSLPTMSIAMDIDDLFGTSAGIYHNTQGRGRGWERPCSVELIDPVDGGVLQIDCGIRMQGFTSRDPNRNPKHSLRLVFRKQYGAGKLRHKLFGRDAADEFDTIVLRSNSQDAWVYDAASNRAGQFVRDEWNRQTQLAMGHPSPHGTWVHLYLNGIYWGVYNPTERPDANFAASYFGGDAENYDSLKNHEEVIDGNGAAYNELLALIQNDPNNFGAGYRDFTSHAAYQEIQGNNLDGTPNPALPDYLDLPNLIDYMIHNMYSAATDWPGNNYIGRDRTAVSTGFKFFDWDNEHGMKPSVTTNRTLPHSRDNDSPTKFHHPLRANAEYRMLFADHLHCAFFNDGPLTAENAAARWMDITGEIEQALIAESARWGDYRRAAPYTVEGDFKPLRQSLLDNWFPQRSDIVLGQFRAHCLYPGVTAPGFAQHGGVVAPGHLLAITAAEGTIYYTLDGSDPRLPGGAPNPAAVALGSGTVEEELVALGAGDWRYLDDGVAQDDGAWRQPGFDDTAWVQGAAPLGYGGVGSPPVATTVGFGPEAGNKFPTTYFRKAFSVAGAAGFTELALSLRRDDGAVVYLNGLEIARSNLPPGEITYATLATDGVGGVDEEASFAFAHALAPGQLLEGANVIAVEVHQSEATSSDLVLDLSLTGTRASGGGAAGPVLDTTGSVKARALHDGQWSALNEATFIVGTAAGPGNLAVTELLYNPDGGYEREFVELMNIHPTDPIDLTGVHFSDGIQFTFPVGFILAPGERVLIVKNQVAFEGGFGSGLNVTGEFIGRLDNGGETITISAPDDSTIRSFTYDNRFPWPTNPNSGYSLTLIAPESDPDHSDPANWRSGVSKGGSPGGSDATTFSGDPLTDEDSDGQSAFLEYALAGDDSDPSKQGGFRIFFPEAAGGLYQMIHKYTLAADDAVIEVQTSTDLRTWQPSAPGSTSRVEILSGGRAEMTFFGTTPAAPLGQFFVRLSVRPRN